MSILAKLHHATRYAYDRPVALGPQIVRLRPAPHCRTRVPSYSLTVLPEKHFVNWQQDPHGNWLARLVFPEKTSEFAVTVDLTADLAVINPFDFFVETTAEAYPFAYDEELRFDLGAYATPEPAGERLKNFLAGLRKQASSTISFL
ncbi:MAG: IMP dehydrogenase, partial [Methylobacteriaceae bacterium]|nr:IMP dehydrogenase [Methylobacteriaceae bacterium]